MDTRRLPYPIPGPAGGIAPSRLAHSRQNDESKTLQQQQADRFSTMPWTAMQRKLRVPPHGPNYLNASLAVLRCNALARAQHKLHVLPVLVESLTWVGRDASVILRDPTATLRATVHATVFSENPDFVIRVGTVLVLDEVVAFAYSNRPSGIRINVSASLHLNIRPHHIQHVFPPSHQPATSAASSSASTSTSVPSRLANPADAYTLFAKAPPLPKLPQPTVDVARSPEPMRPAHARPHTPIRPPSRPLRPHNPHPSHSPHQHPPLPAVRKRPFSNPNSYPHKRNTTQSPYHPSRPLSSASSARLPAQANAVSAITDDHLDSLLGDFDMDAVIAAHGKSQSQLQSQPQSQPQPSPTLDVTSLPPPQPPPPPAASQLTQTIPQPQASRSLYLATAPTATAPTAASPQPMDVVPKQPPLEPEKASTQPAPSLTPTTAAPISQPPAPANNAITQSASLSGVDDAMIESLFDGLDASDF